MSRRAYLVALFCLLGVILPTSSQGPGKPLEYTHELFPLKVGEQRTYLVGDPNLQADQMVTIKVARGKVVEIKRMEPDPDDKEKKKLREVKVQVQAYEIESTSGERPPQVETVAVLNDGVYRFHALGKEITPPVCFLKIPAVPGQSWDVDSTTDSQVIKAKFTSKEESIKLGKETVTAIKSYSEDFQMGKKKLKVAYWFIPTRGLVKQHVQAGGYNIVMTLVP